MPSYFFHLLFELYPPLSVLHHSPGITSERQREARKEQSAPKYFMPGRGFDIFDTRALVDHGEQNHDWGEEDKQVSQLPAESLAGEGREEGLEGIGTDKAKTRNGKRHIDFRFGRVTAESIDLVPSTTQQISSASVTFTSSLSNSKSYSTSTMLSQSPESLNMGTQNPIVNNLLKPPPTSMSYSQAVTGATNNSSTAPNAASQSSPSKNITRSRVGAYSAPPKARYMPLNSKTTEFGYGVVHLYRDGEETQGIYPVPESYAAVNGDYSGSTARALSSSASASGTSSRSGADGQQNSEKKEEDEDALKTVAILAVPSYMTASDFMGFVGEDTRERVSHFRMIRTGKANRYMVLMRFRDKEGAREFVRLFNGRVFNSMEPENCHVVFIKSIQFSTPTNSVQSSAGSFPLTISNDPFSPITPPPPPSQPSPPTASTISTKPAPPPTPSLLELPTCPVCLERMDETTGLLTILCQHVFHCACLSKWRDSSCPVCRYTQAGVVGRAHRDIGDVDESEEFCNVCGADSNLWICLICGHIGCGRYDDAHAFAHYQNTGHAYAMDVDTQRVWDYAGDGYVHRLIQNKSDGKLVELPSALANTTTNANPAVNGSEGDYVPREKLDNIGMEYTYLLTSQLESQRTYFEEKVAQAADKAASAMRDAERATSLSDQLTQELKELKSQYIFLTTETIPQLTKEKERAERKAVKFSEVAGRLEEEWKEEKTMNGSLLEKVKILQKQAEEREKEVKELKEQVRDLMFFLEAREKLKDGGEEVEGGTVTVAEAPQMGGRKKKGKGKR